MRSRRSSMANFGEAFLSATSASDVGSTQDDVLGFHGHALRSRRRSALRNPSRAAARFTKLDSTPQESSSHRTPFWNGSPNSPRPIDTVMHNAAPQLAT